MARFTEAVTDTKILEKLVRAVAELEAPGETDFTRDYWPKFGSFASTPKSFSLTSSALASLPDNRD